MVSRLQAEHRRSAAPRTLIVTVPDSPMPREAASAMERAIEEQRCASRFRLEPQTVFARMRLVSQPAKEVEVYDESLFGICLVMADTQGMAIGMELELQYFATALMGTIRHITPGSNDVFLVGISTRTSS
jgi:hypothetical protein